MSLEIGLMYIPPKGIVFLSTCGTPLPVTLVTFAWYWGVRIHLIVHQNWKSTHPHDAVLTVHACMHECTGPLKHPLSIISHNIYIICSLYSDCMQELALVDPWGCSLRIPGIQHMKGVHTTLKPMQLTCTVQLYAWCIHVHGSMHHRPTIKVQVVYSSL